MTPETEKNAGFAEWRKRNTKRIQAGALAGVLVGCFALFASLSAGDDPLAVACFALIALSMAVTMAL